MFFIHPRHQSQIKFETSDGKKLVCTVCQNPISSSHYLFAIDGSTPYHTFENPNQSRFDIMTLSYCYALTDASPPCSEFTWFPGYDWVIVCCSFCREHLGWRFVSSEKQPEVFFGMIQSKLKEFSQL